MIGQTLDDYADSLGDAGPELVKGKGEYSIGKKKQKIEQALKDAEIRSRRRFTSAGLPHAISIEFDKLRKAREFTPDEKARIDLLAQGGDETQRLARHAGRFSARGALPFAIDFIVGPHLGIPPGVIMGGAEVGRQVARRMALRDVHGLMDLVEAGGDEDKLEKVIGDRALKAMKSRAEGREALKRWGKSATPSTTRALALAIARATNMPQLIPRIEGEINGLQQTSD
jgi:hypothetical protein